MRAGRPKKFFENLLRAYSYTLFDDIGRTIEVGELLTRKTVPILMHESQVKYDSIAQRFVPSGVRREITRSYYDEAVYTDIVPYFAQENLRPRVSSVTYQDKAGTAFDRATHYSYDVHGNVKTLIQQVRDGQRELKKRIDYDYDLVSGKINRIYYQKGESDQFIHRYHYDGDNRITGVQTSRDGIVWTQDAAYAYYAHGPLARAIIGDSLEIQDHAYTLQGWMKALNGQYFSYALGYFSGDYRSIGTNDNLATPVAASKDLYNGNIATMASLNPKLSATTWTQQFEYDQLNRIKASASIGLAHVNAYKTSYRYDANGNILNLHRYNEAGDAFDSLVYHYENRAGGYLRNTNKLRWVDDSPALSGNHAEDLEDQDMDNYRYDDLGNLVYDAQEEIVRIEWNVYGKISKVIRTEASTRPDLEFLYDATGNRVAKIVKPKDANATITYYIRDAQGNVLSVYKKSESGQTAELEEQYIYGSSRVGMLAAGGANNTRTLGLRSYELTDHLGNVRTVISDKPTALGLTEMLAAYDYYPGGMIARKEDAAYRYLYGGMEREDEIAGVGGGDYNFGSRIYNSRTIRWGSADPKSGKYPSWSPYHFGYNNPITTIDPDGEENVVVVGSQNDNSAGNKLMFVNQAFRQLKWYKKNESSETRSLVLFTAGYTPKQIDRITEIAQKKYGATVISVTSSKELANYVNSKSQDCNEASDARQADPVSNMDAFAHGLVGSIEFGYKMGGKIEADQRFDESTAKELNPGAFSENAVFTSYACRTGLGNPAINYFRSPAVGTPYGGYVPAEDLMQDQSLAQKIANTVGIKVRAYATRSDYSATLGTWMERKLFKVSPKLVPEFTESYNSSENIDGADLRPNGAVHPVTGGSTPVGVPNDLQTFKPKE